MDIFVFTQYLHNFLFSDDMRCFNIFLGHELTDASKLGTYFHFFPPENLHERTLLAKANHDKAIDFLPPIEEDIPKGKTPF